MIERARAHHENGGSRVQATAKNRNLAHGGEVAFSKKENGSK